MLMQLDKWYFDCQTDLEFGYYYVCQLSIGKLKLISSAVHHYGKDEVVHWSRLGRAHASGLRDLRSAGAEIRARLLTRLGSGGFEEKYWVNARLNGFDYSGPMEEVRWNER